MEFYTLSTIRCNSFSNFSTLTFSTFRISRSQISRLLHLQILFSQVKTLPSSNFDTISNKYLIDVMSENLNVDAIHLLCLQLQENVFQYSPMPQSFGFPSILQLDDHQSTASSSQSSSTSSNSSQSSQFTLPSSNSSQSSQFTLPSSKPSNSSRYSGKFFDWNCPRNCYCCSD